MEAQVVGIRMEGVFVVTFLFLLSVLIGIEKWKGRYGSGTNAASTASLPNGFSQFRNSYVLVYSLMMGMECL